ncbi:MAG TPA: lipid-A-disaccharide synthase, partial [Chitinophagaceae bacterium]|nr:lipid-A-disaccharide synthase [Chitinophagaceae bacterium]
MQAAGSTLVKHYRELAFMGFVEVIKNLPTILNNIKFCKEDILSFNPDIIVLIDYPGFNLRIAEWGKQNNFKIVYYISPQVWAWKENRVKKMKRDIDKMLVILPFEKDYFKNKWNWDVEYVGHPLVEIVEESRKSEVGSRELGDEKIIALLPGSRKQEIAKKLPIMLSVAKSFPEYKFIVAKSPGLEDSFYEEFFNSPSGIGGNISSVKNDTYNLLMKSNAALVTSGTATLETALFAVPEVVCYKAGTLSYEIGKRLVNVKFISLVNLIMDKLVVKELIQTDLTTKNLIAELNELLSNKERRQQLQKDYADLKNILSAGGHASFNAAKSIVAAIS